MRNKGQILGDVVAGLVSIILSIPIGRALTYIVELFTDVSGRNITRLWIFFTIWALIIELLIWFGLMKKHIETS